MQEETGTPLTADDPAGAPAAPRPRRRMFWIVLAIAALWVATDQLTKTWAEAALDGGRVVPVVGELLQLRLVYNPGAAFSFATNATFLLTGIAIAVSAFVIWQASKLASWGWTVALGLLLGGAMGNLTDRIFRAPGVGQGHVVDFLALPNFPVFNVADIGITSAAVLIVLLSLLGVAPDGMPSDDSPRRRRSERGAAGE